MKPAAIKELLEKFYEGATSEQEEQMLRDYFSQENVHGSLVGEKLYFDTLTSAKDEKLDESFDEALFSKLVDEKPKKSIRIRLYSISAIAATLAILITIWFGTDLLRSKELYGTINDPKIAFVETKKVLDEVSKKMNQGLKPAKETVTKVEKNVQKAGEVKKMDNALKKTEGLKKINETMDSFNKVYVSFGG